MQRRTFLAGLVLTAAAGAILALAPGARLPLAAQAQEGPVIEDIVIGSPEAPVEVIEYASFTCPHCANFHKNVFPQLKADYIDTGKVRFVYREVYFDRFGLWAAMVARCGGTNERYFAIAEMIYDRQQQWTAGGDPAAIAGNLRTIGKVAGLPEDRLEACLTDGATAQAMVQKWEEHRERDGIDSTPSFVIDGQKHSNMSWDDFRRILDERLQG
jgi:protein-disulfide isomerase